MATGLIHVTAALQHIGVLAEGASPSTDEQTVGLANLNALVNSWSAIRARVDAKSRKDLADLAVQAGQIAASAAGVVSASTAALSRAIDGSSAQAAIASANTTAATIATNAATLLAGCIASFTITAMATFALISTDNTYSVGMDAAIQYNLAVRLAGVFKRPIPPEVLETAKQTYAAVMPQDPGPDAA